MTGNSGPAIAPSRATSPSRSNSETASSRKRMPASPSCLPIAGGESGEIHLATGTSPPCSPSNSIIMSWPSTALNPNKGTHWTRLRVARKAQQHEAFWLAEKAGLVVPDSERIIVRLDFHPRHKNRRDEDNMLGSMKGALDGLAKALGVDDSRFKPMVTIHPADGRNVVIMSVEAGE